MSDDTTWFWKIVDARGLADVSSDEFVALNELISKAERAEAAESALTAAEAERDRLREDRDSWRRVAERLETEKQAARAALSTAKEQTDV